MTLNNKSFLRCIYCHGSIADERLNVCRCRHCGHIYERKDGIWQFLKNDQINYWKDYFDQKAGTGGETAETVGYMSKQNFALIQRGVKKIVRGLGVEHGRILDAGCGHGGFSKDFVCGHDVYGVDFSCNMLKMAVQKGIEAYQADVNCLPFATDAFDLVLSVEVIQHVDDTDIFLSELMRATRPGGFLIISGLNKNSVIRNVNRLAKKILGRHEPMPTLISWPKIVRQALMRHGSLKEVVSTYYPLPILQKNQGLGKARLCLASNIILCLENRS